MFLTPRKWTRSNFVAISVNGIEISEDAVLKEQGRHAHAVDQRKAAIESLVVREVLLQTARRKLAEDLSGELQCVSEKSEVEAEAFIEEALIEQLIEKEVVKPQLADQECETYYKKYPAQFRTGALVEASHILFESIDGQATDALRQKALLVLQQVLQEPSRFAELAHTHSDCTSAALGGNLGQLSPGDTVPEFETVIFNLEEGKVASGLIESRFGLHIAMVSHRAEGRLIPYEMVREKLAAHLLEQKGKYALRRYLKKLLGAADIQGMELEATDSDR